MSGKKSKRNFMTPCILPEMGRDSFVALERERSRVDAVALAGWIGTIVEHVAKMGVAAAAQHLGAAHEVTIVLIGCDVLRRRGLPEARPTGTGIKLVIGAEQLHAAADAMVDADA